jgi:hypothetical protein
MAPIPAAFDGASVLMPATIAAHRRHHGDRYDVVGNRDRDGIVWAETAAHRGFDMPRLRKVLPVVVLIVGACGSASSPSPSGTPVASPSPAVGSPSPAASGGDILVLTAGSAPLPAGTYTQPGFRPEVQFAVEDGWFAGTVTDGFFDVQQEKGTPDVIAVQFAQVDGIASAAASPMSATTVAAAVKAIHANPTLVVVDESASRIGGLEGLNVIVENRGAAPAPVMQVSAGTLSIDPGRKLWISVFNTADGLLAVMVGGSIARWDRTLSVAEPVLESVVIGPSAAASPASD